MQANEEAGGAGAPGSLLSAALLARRRELWVLRGGYPQLHREMAGALALSARAPGGPGAGVDLTPVVGEAGSQCTVRTMRIRDVLAFACMHIAAMWGGKVYGGFPRDMFAGVPLWGDLDMHFASARSIAAFKRSLCRQLRMVFGCSLAAFALDLVDTEAPAAHHRGPYSFEHHRHVLRFAEPGGRRHRVQLDLCVEKAMRCALRGAATLGSSLRIEAGGGIEWNPIAEGRYADQYQVTLEELTDMLRRGHDIEVWPSLLGWRRMQRESPGFSARPVREYHERVRAKLLRKGFTLVDTWGTPADAFVSGAAREEDGSPGSDSE